MLVIAAVAIAGETSGQESIRPSLAGAEAAEARRPSFRIKPNYNLKLGPVLFDLQGSLGLEFNDNVNLSDTNRESDLILRPQLNLNAFWQVTPLNSLQLDLGLGYDKYLFGNGKDTRSVLITPNSQLSFDIFVGDFRINIHDRFSISQNPIEELQLSNVSDYSRFQNEAGISVLWDLNDIKVTFGYDHYNFKAISEGYSFLDRAEEQFNLSAGFNFRDGLIAGLESSAAIIDYDETYNNDGTSFSVGAFLDMQVSNYVKFRVAGGYQAIDFDSGGGNLDVSDASGPYANLTLVHRLNNYFTHSISAGYETRLGLTTNYVDIAFARYHASWRMNDAITLTFDAFYEDAQESNTALAEDARRFGTAVGFGYQFTKKLSVRTRYEFSNKDSNIQDRDYYQNRAMIDLAYDF